MRSAVVERLLSPEQECVCYEKKRMILTVTKRSSMRLLDIVAIAGSLGLSLFVCICVGVAIGRFIDVYTGYLAVGD